MSNARILAYGYDATVTALFGWASSDHYSMCKFESSNAPSYQLIVAALMKNTLNAPTTVTHR